MKKASLILVLSLVLLTSVSNAQNQKLASAFEQSYTHEYESKIEQAITDLKTVYSEKSYEINLRLGWLYYSAEKYKEAIQYYDKAAKLMPAASEPLWAIINAYTKQENWVAVEKAYKSILALDPKNNTANYQLGLIYYYRKDFTTAKRYFDIALNLNPFNYNNMLMSAWNNYFLGNKNAASILFNKVLLYNPKDTSALEGLSLLK